MRKWIKACSDEYSTEAMHGRSQNLSHTLLDKAGNSVLDERVMAAVLTWYAEAEMGIAISKLSSLRVSPFTATTAY